MAHRPLALIVGLALVAGSLRLATSVPVWPEMGRAFLYVGWRESFFWLTHFLLAVPGLLVIAWATAPWVGPVLLRLGSALTALADGRPKHLSLGFAVLVLLLALAGRHGLLLGLPVTNDEDAVHFGAQILASGQVSIETPEAVSLLPLYFTYEREGRLYTLDFPGAQLLRALFLRLGWGDWPYALIAALGALATVAAGRRLAGGFGAVSVAVLWLLSPMVGALSLTAHAHLISRTLVAVAFWVYVRAVVADDASAVVDPPRFTARSFLLFGFAAGAAFFVRPAEAGLLLLPPAMHLAWRAWRTGGRARALPLLSLVGVAPSFLGHALFNHATTGRWYLPVRGALMTEVAPDPLRTPWVYWGENFGFNALMLAIWVLGPVVWLLVRLGLARRAPVATTLAAAAVLHLSLGFLHHDTGVHVVGPIHYSETVVPLLLLSVLGLAGLRDWARSAGSARATLVVSLAAAYALGLITFQARHATVLRAQAEITRAPRAALDGLRNAVVLADPPARLWLSHPVMRETGTWVARFPMPDPFLENAVVVVSGDADPTSVARLFPGRRRYRMTYHDEGEPVRLSRLP